MAAVRRMVPRETALRGPNDVGMLALYPDGTILVQINTLAAIVWPQKNFRNSVERKASKAHEAGDVPRLPPMADDIFVEFERAEEYLNSWAHRDAHAALAAFDFAAWRRRAQRCLATYAARKKATYRAQIASLQEAHDEWAEKEAAFRARADN